MYLQESFNQLGQIFRKKKKSTANNYNKMSQLSHLINLKW